MGRQIEVVIPYDPRQQFEPFHNRTERWSCIVAHRRAGKTVACVNDLIRAALTSQKPNPRFAYIAPYYSQAKDIAWQYLKEYALVVPGAQAHESELRVDFPNGGRVRLYGAENYDRLRGLYLDGVVLDEPADMDPRVFPEVVRPALSDRKGFGAWIGTPKGHNHFHDVWRQSTGDPDWFSLSLKASETGILSQPELNDARRSMTADQFEQEYECSFEAAILGAYYGTLMREAEEAGRIGRVPYDRHVRVHTAWDLGVEDATAIWFIQRCGLELHVVDYYEASGVGLDHYVDVLRQRREEHRFQWGSHFLPHDIQARELSTGKSRLETLGSLGLDSIEVVPIHHVQDGINATRRILERCWFDAERCERGIEALKQYRTEYDEKRKVFRPKPLHDWTSHAADALRIFAAQHDDAPTIRNDRYRKKAAGPNSSWMAA